MRASAYARYSSDRQRETSIDDQVAATQRYAAQRDWALCADHVYRDAGISGASLEGRPGIQALLQAASRTPRPFDVVLVDDSSRVARDLRDALHVMRMLKFFGIRTIYISQQIDSDNEQAETLLTVHGLVDGLYLQELSKKTKRGIQGQQTRGFSTGGKTYAYRAVPEFDPSGKRDGDGPAVIGKRLEVDPVQAAVVRQVFRWYAEGVSHPKMADRLNAMEAPTPRGTRWTKHHTDRMLRNERYRGKAIWGQVVLERRPGTNQRVARKQPRDTWHVEDRPELRIIDDDLWRRAQARRDAVRASLNLKTGRASGRSGLYSSHLLVGLSHCGICGKAFTIAGSPPRSARGKEGLPGPDRPRECTLGEYWPSRSICRPVGSVRGRERGGQGERRSEGPKAGKTRTCASRSSCPRGSGSGAARGNVGPRYLAIGRQRSENGGCRMTRGGQNRSIDQRRRR